MLLFLLLVFMAVVPLHAQIKPPQRVGVEGGLLSLSLRHAIEMALASNLEIEVERSNTLLAQHAIQAAQGFYDPTIQWVPGFQYLDTPTSSVLQGNGKLTDRFHNQNFQFQQKLPWAGSSLSASFDNARQSTSNPFVSLTPFITSRLFFNFTQPLWRNRLIDQERTELKIRRRQFDISETEFELKVIDVVTRVERWYWNLVAARQDVEVNADSVKLAREQLERNQRMIDAGVLPPVEISASEAELERRLDTWYSSIGTLTEVENTLKSLLSPNREDSLWNKEVLPTDERTANPPEVEDLSQAVAMALKERPETQLVQVRQQSNEIQKQFNLNQTKPRLDFVAVYGNTGLGGAPVDTENIFSTSNQILYERVNQLSASSGLPPLSPPNFDFIPELLVGGYGTTLANLFSGRFQTVQVGLAFDLNFRNRTAQANFSQSLVTEKRLKLEQSLIEQAIELQTRNALQSIQTTRQRIQAAEASARAAREKLDSEIRLFQNGESTNFLVLTRQNEYRDSQRRTVVAHLDYNKAVGQLAQALGSTLRTHRISLN